MVSYQRESEILVILNVDKNVVSNPSNADFGGLVRRSDNSFIFEFYKVFDG